MGFFKKITRPIRKIAKKIIPKEIKPFIPYAAAMIPGAQGLAGLSAAGITNVAAQKALLAGLTAAATDEDANILRTAALAAAPDVLSSGLGAVGTKLGVPSGVDVEKTMTFAERIGEGARTAQGAIGRTNPLKIAGVQTAVDSAAKFAEINQQEIDDYNANLLSQGLKDKGARRNAIYNIYINAGYEPDYVNGVLDRYGYAEGGGVMEAAAARMTLKDFAREIREKQKKKKRKKANGGRIGFTKGGRAEIITGLLNIKDADGNLIYSYEDAVDKANELLPDEVSSTDLQTAAGSLEQAFGRPFGNMEPVPMLRFARGGEVIEETEDLGIMDLMKDQGIEYGEQVSNAQNDEILERLFEEYLDLGFSPEDAAKKAREAFDNMSQGQGIKGTQVASGYKTDIEDMYEQYVFEMEEMGLQPMSFSEFLAQARAGMADGGKVKRRKKGQEDDSDGKKPGPRSFPKFDEDRLFEEKMPKVLPNKPDMMDAAMGGIASMADGGIMEKDMRGGGFIPEGSKERADDVPARLSKNEFVMTADAVRAAGGGSVNKGAKRMYDMMYNLEGKV
jgi:hypothetical protein